LEKFPLLCSVRAIVRSGYFDKELHLRAARWTETEIEIVFSFLHRPKIKGGKEAVGTMKVGMVPHWILLEYNVEFNNF
jgi:hypothetical protein